MSVKFTGLSVLGGGRIQEEEGGEVAVSRVQKVVCVWIEPWLLYSLWITQNQSWAGYTRYTGVLNMWQDPESVGAGRLWYTEPKVGETHAQTQRLHPRDKPDFFFSSQSNPSLLRGVFRQDIFYPISVLKPYIYSIGICQIDKLVA